MAIETLESPPEPICVQRGQLIEDLPIFLDQKETLEKYRARSEQKVQMDRNTHNESYFLPTVSINGLGLVEICKGTLPDLIERLENLHITHCGKFHERGEGLGPDECPLRPDNLACGHPEGETQALLCGSLWLAQELGVFTADRAHDLWKQIRALIQEDTSLSSIDKQASKGYYPNRSANTDQPEDEPVYKTAIQQEAVVAGKLQRIAGEIAAGLEHVLPVEQESDVAVRLQKKVQLQSRFTLESVGNHEASTDKIWSEDWLQVQTALVDLAGATKRQERITALSPLIPIVGKAVSRGWRDSLQKKGVFPPPDELPYEVHFVHAIAESLLGHAIPLALLDRMDRASVSIKSDGFAARSQKYNVIARLLGDFYETNGFDRSEAGEKAKNGANLLFAAGFFQNPWLKRKGLPAPSGA